ncbi:MAG: hypothetical protein AMS18_13560 [Gemmatimonas sp. SG8_17]|nr:MAG: hypothetical protein AMS18_13560 [Gemmatimonas sp. SG8_17]
MTIATKVLPYHDDLQQVEFRWNHETEILVGDLPGVVDGENAPHTIELGGTQGSYMSLNVQDGILTGIEVVVWPRGHRVEDLSPPEVTRTGRLQVTVAGATASPGVVELDVPLFCTRDVNESRVHLAFGSRRVVEVVALAKNLIAEIDKEGDLAGIWLTDVPRFSGARENS